jgi:MSHA biogenesis protein MshQ
VIRRLVCLLLLLLAAGARADVPLTLFKSWAGNVNFTGTVVTLRDSSANVCSVYPANTTLSVALAGIPTGATILAAHLYWAGSGSTPDYTVGFESGTVTATPARSYTSQSVGYDYFSGAIDVTAQVQARRNGNYQFYGLTVNNGAPYCGVQGVLAAMALLVVYSDNSQPYRVLHLYEGFQYFRDTSLSTTVSNLKLPSPLTAAMTGRVGHITFEGDGTAGQTGEDLAFNGTNMADALNPSGNQFNSKSNINGATASYGVDFDAWDVAAPIIVAGQTSATTLYTSGSDMVLLSAQLIAVPSVPAVDIGITMTRNGTFTSGVAGSYTLSFYNRGTATENGPVTVVDTLPAGVSYLSFSTARGWGCSASGQVVTCKMNGLFTPNTSLPDLTLNVLPGAEGSITNSATVSGVDYDYYTSNNTASDTTAVARGTVNYVFTDSACKPDVAFGTAGQCAMLKADTRLPAALAQDGYITTLANGVPVARSTTASSTVPLYFAMTCVLPVKNAGVGPTINGTALPVCADGPGAPASQTGAFSGAISIVFAANAPSSKITVFYADVGKVLLSVKELAGNISTSPSVIFRPVSLQIAVTGNPAPVSSTSAPFRAAGMPFPVKVQALMSNNAPAPNFGNGDASIALTPAAPAATGTADEKAMAAAMGSVPALVVSGMGTGAGGAFNGSATFSEVGVIVLTASVSGGYFGVADVAPALLKVGRFYPFAFRTRVTPVFGKCTDVFAACATSTPGAAYATQAFDVAVTPLDAASKEVNNFRGVFGRTINLSAFGSAAGSTQNPGGTATSLAPATIAALSATDTNAALHTAVAYALLRPFDRTVPANSAWTGPTPIFLRATVLDAPVTITSQQADTSLEAGITILNGRLLLATVSGSELLRLPVTMKAQFWLPGTNGGAWTTNPVDNSATPTTIAFSSCKRNLLVAGACYSGLTMTARDTVFSAGVGKFFIGAPGTGKTGSAMFNMTGAPAWLPNTQAQAIFGAYRSNVLYFREVY